MLLSKKDFIDVLAEKAGVTKKDAAEMYEDVFGVLHEVLSEGKGVSIPDIGKFEIKQKEARTARNPRTGETVEVPAKNALKFKASKVLKEAVAQTM